MKAIILAAGEWTRLRPLTYKMPKAMVKVGEKTLLEHNMDRLLPYVDEFIIVIKYKKETITEHLWNTYKWIRITYHEQGEEKGTWAAVKGIKTSGDIIIAYSDAIISQEDVDNIMTCKEYAVLVKEVSNPEKYGIFRVDSEEFAQEIIEKPKKYVWNLANFSFFKVNDSLLEIVNHLKLSPRWEIEITDAINEFVKSNKMKCLHLKNELIDITSLHDIEQANKKILSYPSLWTSKYMSNIWELEVFIGIDKKYFSQIVEHSADDGDSALQNNTSDKKRFSSIESLSKWYQDNDRYVFTLTSKQNEIAWILWYRPSLPPIMSEKVNISMCELCEQNKDFIHTSGIRMYPNFRGKWLALPFLLESEKYYKMIFPVAWVCIDIEKNNIPSQKIFEKAWYQFIWWGENQKSVDNEIHARMVYVKCLS